MTDIYLRILNEFSIPTDPQLAAMDPLNLLGPKISQKILQREDLTEEEFKKLDKLLRKIWRNIFYILTRDYKEGDIYLAFLHSDNILESWIEKDPIERYLWGKESLSQGPTYFWNLEDLKEKLKYQTQSETIELPDIPEEERTIRTRPALMLKRPEEIPRYDKHLRRNIELLPEEVRYLFNDEVTKEYVLRVLEAPKYLRQSSLEEFVPAAK